MATTAAAPPRDWYDEVATDAERAKVDAQLRPGMLSHAFFCKTCRALTPQVYTRASRADAFRCTICFVCDMAWAHHVRWPLKDEDMTALSQ